MLNVGSGALVGPPWSKRENGFVLRETGGSGVSVYYEPHCDYDEQSLRSTGAEGVDVVITPASSQLVAKYELVGSPISVACAGSRAGKTSTAVASPKREFGVYLVRWEVAWHTGKDVLWWVQCHQCNAFTPVLCNTPWGAAVVLRPAYSGFALVCILSTLQSVTAWAVVLQVQGNSNVVKLLQQLKPSVVVPLLNASFPMAGPFSTLIYEEGSADQLDSRLQQANVGGIKVQMPAPVNEPTRIALLPH